MRHSVSHIRLRLWLYIGYIEKYVMVIITKVLFGCRLPYNNDDWINDIQWFYVGLQIQLYLSTEACHFHQSTRKIHLNSMLISSLHSAVYVLRWTGSALVQIMACCLFSAKPSPEPMLFYCQLNLWEQTLMELESKYKTFHSWKCIWKWRLWNGGHFAQGWWVNVGQK